MNAPDLSTEGKLVYLAGRILPAGDAKVAISDEGLLYGLGFFETFRTSGGRLHHWRFNRARLENACATAGIVLPGNWIGRDESRLAAVVRELSARNNLGPDAVFRYTATAGSEKRPLDFLVGRPLPQPAPTSGIALRVLKLRRDSGEWQPRPKSLNYANALLGARELQRRALAASDDGLFLSQSDDVVVETPRQNLAWIKGGRIHCSDSSTGAVDGTCQAWVQTCGLSLNRVRANLRDVLNSEALFCLNSVRGITAVASIWDENDVKQLGAYDSAQHPAVLELQERWAEALMISAESA